MDQKNFSGVWGSLIKHHFSTGDFQTVISKPSGKHEFPGARLHMRSQVMKCYIICEANKQRLFRNYFPDANRAPDIPDKCFLLRGTEFASSLLFTFFFFLNFSFFSAVSQWDQNVCKNMKVSLTPCFAVVLQTN